MFEPFLHLLETSRAFLTGCTFALGLAIGSFLNVVILRLPVMMEREWRRQCAESEGRAAPPEEPFNLITPPSRCPACGTRIRPLDNLPLVSWLLLRGRCRACGATISVRYPLIELLTGLCSAGVAWHFGFGWALAGALLLTWVLIALTVIDLDHQLLPDALTLPFLWVGLLFSLGHVFTDPRSAILGAVSGYLSLWTVYQVFRLATGKEGMGFGDFKLLAMLGAWLGWQALPLVILLSSLVGAAVGIALIVTRRGKRDTPIPFGPYLAAAGWIALLWRDVLIGAWLGRP
ncbi:MAG TPA: A24 family peptidase [Gammaproteobacteria bacterium]|nr:A24 family peptidase [Gammaproteobacteria bacterium]